MVEIVCKMVGETKIVLCHSLMAKC